MSDLPQACYHLAQSAAVLANQDAGPDALLRSQIWTLHASGICVGVDGQLLMCCLQRTYDFIEVCGWFAARCDLILLLFDPAKLDISDEMKQVCPPPHLHHIV